MSLSRLAVCSMFDSPAQSRVGQGISKLVSPGSKHAGHLIHRLAGRAWTEAGKLPLACSEKFIVTITAVTDLLGREDRHE